MLFIFDQMQFSTISNRFPFIYLVSWSKGSHIFPYFLLIPLLVLFLLYRNTYFLFQLLHHRVMKFLIWILHPLGLSLHKRSLLNFHTVFCLLLLVFLFMYKCQISPAVLHNSSGKDPHIKSYSEKNVITTWLSTSSFIQFPFHHLTPAQIFQGLSFA